MAAARLIVAEAGSSDSRCSAERKLSERRWWCTYEKYVHHVYVQLYGEI